MSGWFVDVVKTKKLKGEKTPTRTWPLRMRTQTRWYEEEESMSLFNAREQEKGEWTKALDMREQDGDAENKMKALDMRITALEAYVEKKENIPTYGNIFFGGQYDPSSSSSGTATDQDFVPENQFHGRSPRTTFQQSMPFPPSFIPPPPPYVTPPQHPQLPPQPQPPLPDAVPPPLAGATPSPAAAPGCLHPDLMVPSDAPYAKFTVEDLLQMPDREGLRRTIALHDPFQTIKSYFPEANPNWSLILEYILRTWFKYFAQGKNGFNEKAMLLLKNNVSDCQEKWKYHGDAAKPTFISLKAEEEGEPPSLARLYKKTHQNVDIRGCSGRKDPH
ncbi:uncharacterized protein LOC130500045 [Raphanus sativus]|uniref:Uncharacterized protein LOC130500045 n=1 Tax=Raphanus sativus TaxID=3726 RepID=A0A9W3CGM2_RAPSA|nr:uncharacterized protein LOC130500045 [Raphanus sativus]